MSIDNDPSGRRGRWVLELDPFDWTIIHKEGVKHRNADALSRRPVSPVVGEVNVSSSACVFTAEQEPRLPSLSVDEADFQRLQREDADISVVVTWLNQGRSGPPPVRRRGSSIKLRKLWTEFSRLSIVNGLLCRTVLSSSDGETRVQIVVPSVMVPDLLMQLHGGPAAAHFSAERVWEKARQTYYWPFMLRDIRQWCEQCRACQTRRCPAPKPKAPMGGSPVTRPLQRVAADILELPVTSRGTDFTLASVLKNQTLFQQFLVKNLSLSSSTAGVLLNSTVSLREVYNLIFGEFLRDAGGAQRWAEDRKVSKQKPEGPVQEMKEKLLGVVQRFNGGLLHKALHDPPREDHRRALVRLMSRALGITDVSGDQSTDQQGVREVEGLLLTGSMLELLTCGERGAAELREILLLPEEQQLVLSAYRGSVCRGGPAERSERFRQLSRELREQIDTQSITEKLHLEQPSFLAALSPAHLRVMLKDLADVERLLKDLDLLSALARLLPKGACAGQKSASSIANGTWPLNATTWGPNTTDSSTEEASQGAQAGGKEEAENPHSQFLRSSSCGRGCSPSCVATTGSLSLKL
ncbi:hypothetical protein OJAV_G00094570 [Oryzias javanicus]|uniref:Gypsy retrotransposon integrase-like protein 1 n=1 Tax=Oryzias javanicus TaxID=123683 RepID=A0A3S2P7W8_ORYJA|nr:hypothetical protein OJAV_G00094570 [Oryzias javanicus]